MTDTPEYHHSNSEHKSLLRYEVLELILILINLLQIMTQRLSKTNTMVLKLDIAMMLRRVLHLQRSLLGAWSSSVPWGKMLLVISKITLAGFKS